MSGSQFGFLRNEFKEIWEHCQRCESYCKSDPRISTWSGRLAVEAALKHYFRISSFLPQPDRAATAGELLRDETFRALDGRRPFNLARSVVNVGNRGAHADSKPPTVGEAVAAAEALFKFMEWFVLRASRSVPAATPSGPFDSGRLPEKPGVVGGGTSLGALLAGTSVERQFLMRMMRHDGVAEPTESLSDEEAARVRKYIDLGCRFSHVFPDSEMEVNQRELLFAISEPMPDDIWVLDSGVLLSSRLHDMWSEALASAFNTAERYRFRWLLVHGELDEVLERIDAIEPNADLLVSSIARAWRSANRGEPRADWMLLDSVDGQIARRLAALLSERSDFTAIAGIPDSLLVPNSDVLGLELSFDVACARLLSAQTLSHDHMWSFLDAWMFLQEQRTDGRAILQSRPALQAVREHLRSHLWLVSGAGDADHHGQLSAILRQVAPGDEIALVAAGLAGEAEVLGSDDESAGGWMQQVRRQFLDMRGLGFVSEALLRDAAAAAAPHRGTGAHVSAGDLIAQPAAREAIISNASQLDLDGNHFHTALAASLANDIVDRTCDTISGVLMRLETLMTEGNTPDG